LLSSLHKVSLSIFNRKVGKVGILSANQDATPRILT
jgi:hypothetical protein